MTKKTTTICCAVAMLATTAATPALSQSKNFAGPSIAIGGGYSSQTYDLKFTDTGTDPVTELSFNNGKNDFSALIDLGYGFQVDKNLAITIGGTYDLTKSKVTPMKVVGPVDDTDPSLGSETTKITSELKDHYSLYIQPTYLVNDNTGLFAKLSYNFVKSVGKISVDDESVSNSKNLEGWGYGIGARTFLDKNLYAQIEGNYVEYENHKVIFDSENSSSHKPKVLSALVSIGYKF
ncbi:K16079 omp31; outer membrane immunogenic protein [Candidatus Pelagibacterales bacterium]